MALRDTRVICVILPLIIDIVKFCGLRECDILLIGRDYYFDYYSFLLFPYSTLFDRNYYTYP